ncbi:MAG: DUF2335 domain-containing protein [Nitrospinae bacterium]|nr:DUF2335 domain-containing protein [Nitrospinota bacterium]
MGKRRKRKNRNDPNPLSNNSLPQPSPSPTPGNTVARRIESISFSGPLPPPNILQKYNDVMPGLAERIVNSAEKQASHRMDLEKIVIQGEDRRAYLGWGSGTVLALLVVLLGAYLVYVGRNVEGFSTLAATAATFAGVFFYGKHKQQKDLAQKRERLERRR